MTPTVDLNPVQVLALAAFGVALGIWLKRRFPLLDRLNVPSAVAGGLVYSLLLLFLRDRFLNVRMDMVLRDILMVAFFTTVGMSASATLIREGGRQLIFFFALATAGVILENVLGVGLALLLGVNPLLGLVCGSVTMAGGPATALAFGSTFEQLGLPSATTLGIAAAMFGIVAGGLLGGFAGGRLIEKNRLQPSDASSPRPDLPPDATMESLPPHMSDPLLNSVIAVAVAMGIGSLISLAIQRTGVILPAYIGAMLAAALIRNLDDRFGFIRISPQRIAEMGSVSLNIFIVMALLTLQLWELVHLALPMLVILAAEVVLVYLLASALVYRAMGRDFQAAVTCGGYCGFMLGTTANALACMEVLVNKYGPAPRAIIVVSLVGAFLIDFTNALIVTTMMNFLR